jgi:hypothetical protein
VTPTLPQSPLPLRVPPAKVCRGCEDRAKRGEPEMSHNDASAHHGERSYTKGRAA